MMQDWGELMLLSYSLTQSFMCRPSECLFGYNRQALKIQGCLFGYNRQAF